MAYLSGRVISPIWLSLLKDPPRLRLCRRGRLPVRFQGQTLRHRVWWREALEERQLCQRI